MAKSYGKGAVAVNPTGPAILLLELAAIITTAAAVGAAILLNIFVWGQVF